MKHLLLVILIIVSSCQNNATQNASENKGETATVERKSETNYQCVAKVKGMVCKMGCGGAIRKELKATNAVANVDFDFEEERPSNNAKISFDKDKISVDKIISIITSINDGQFKVGKSSSEDLIESSTPDTKDENDSEDIKVNVSSSGFEMPNLLDVFSDLITK